jgi:hypothetical protein
MKRFVFLFLLFLPMLAFAQFPNNPNKIRLGNQTTGLGLVQPSDGVPAWTPTTINNAWAAMDTTTGTIYAYFNNQWNALAGSDGNGIFSASNDNDTIRVQVAYIPPGGDFTIRDTSGAATISMNEIAASMTAGNAQVQAVKPLGYLLVQGDSVLINTLGSFGNAGQVLTASGGGGAFWQDAAQPDLTPYVQYSDSINTFVTPTQLSDSLAAIPPGGVDSLMLRFTTTTSPVTLESKVNTLSQTVDIVEGANIQVTATASTLTINTRYDYYVDDAAAATGGIQIGQQYKVDIGNPYGLTWGLIKTRTQ